MSEKWRLPTLDELRTLVGSGLPMRESYCWSSTTYAYYEHYAWAVYFDGGHVDPNGKYDALYVRCVRGGQSRRFGNAIISPEVLAGAVSETDERWEKRDNGDYDRFTGLLWSRDEGKMTWHDAMEKYGEEEGR